MFLGRRQAAEYSLHFQKFSATDMYVYIAEVASFLIAILLSDSVFSSKKLSSMGFVNVRNWELFLPRCMDCSRGIRMGILSVRLSVCLSVRLSVKRVHCDKTKESYV